MIALACAAEGPGSGDDGSVAGMSGVVSGGGSLAGAGASANGSTPTPSSQAGNASGGSSSVGAGSGGGSTAPGATSGVAVPTGDATTSGGASSGETTSSSGTSGGDTTISSGDSSGEPPAEAPSFSDVAFRMNASCAAIICHTGPPYFVPILSDAKGTLYETLMNWVVEGCDDAPLIAPGDPDNSAFLMVLEPGRCAGVPLMPLECPECVTDEDLEVIRAWIAAGALP